jgi:eukaryotic-like serine/threonine-protein kinase
MESEDALRPEDAARRTIDRQEAVFSEAIALPRAQRAGHVALMCGADAALRARVEALLAAADSAGDFLEAPPTLLPEAGSVRHGTRDLSGQHIGRYLLVRRLGEGGAGVVYEAEQQEPVRRRVALKLMKAGTDTESAIARFEAERQTLALMEHPNIAQVFDAGATEGGRLYFVMELVRGERITDYCDGHRLGTAERLRLFVQVCRAVQHAHQKGVIHRDIKPSNILVSVPDGEDCSRGRGPRSGLAESGDSGTAVPKIIDFGIAKAVEGTPSDATQLTTLEQIIGTPAYMSPEQAVFGARDVDTRTDIYSLGALLYELLTGHTPFDTRELLQAGIAAVQQTIREREPLRPSGRLCAASAETRAAIAARCGTDPRTLAHALRGDLDWVVMKCLEKDRQRRYATASELALEIGRYLTCQAVEARPPSVGYRLRKCARRHRTLLAAGAAILLSVLVGFGFAVEGFVEAVRARREAERQREAAVAARDESEAVTTFLSDTLAAASPWAGGPDTSVRAVLDRAGAKVESEFSGSPLLRARLHETIGETLSALGLDSAARTHFEKAVALRSAILGSEDEATLRAQTGLAWALSHYGEGTDAEAVARQTLAQYARHPDYSRLDVARLKHALGEALHVKGQSLEAIDWESQAAATFEAELGPCARDTLAVKHSLIKANFIAGRYPAARAICREIAALVDLPADDPSRVQVALMAVNVETELGHHDAAEAIACGALPLAEKLFGGGSGVVRSLRLRLGYTLVVQGRVEEGLPMLETAAAEIERLGSPKHVNTILIPARLVPAYARLGRYEEAVAVGRQTLNRIREIHGDADLTGVLWASGLVEALSATGRGEEAEALSRELLAGLLKRPFRHEYGISRARIGLADALRSQARFEEAERELLANHATLAALDFDVSDQRRTTCEALARLCDETRRPEEAARWRTELESIPAPE